MTWEGETWLEKVMEHVSRKPGWNDTRAGRKRRNSICGHQCNDLLRLKNKRIACCG